MLVPRAIGVICLLAGVLAAAGDSDPKKLAKRAQEAEKKGKSAEAYLLYSEAAALDPKTPQYWVRAQALRAKAAAQAKPKPGPLPGPTTSAPRATAVAATDAITAPAVPHPDLPLKPKIAGLPAPLSEQDLEDVRRLKPPPELKPAPGRKAFHLRADARSLFEQVAKAFGLDTVFDGDYQPGAQIRFETPEQDFRTTMNELQSATASFVVPLSERLMFVAKDTPQKRTELEPTVAITVPIPAAISVQEAQEIGRAVQQAMELTRLAVDPQRQLVVMKDRISKVRPAQALFEQLSHQRAQVEIEVEMLEINDTSAISYGLMHPTEFPLVYLGRMWHSEPTIPGTIRTLLLFGGGKTLFGFGIADAQMFAQMNRSTSRSLLKATIRSLDGEEATFHVGDRYPVMTGGFLAGTNTFGGLPSFNFEDLGLVIKVKPHVQGIKEVALDLDAEFKVLAGQAVNGIPIIANRKLQSKVTLREGQWGIVAGLMSNTEAKTVSGMWGLVNVPYLGKLFRQNDINKTGNEVVIVIRPHLLSPPPSEYPTPPVFLGPEARLKIPL